MPTISAASLSREALDVSQDDGGAPLHRKLFERDLQRPLELVIERLGLRAEARGLRQRDDRVFAVRIGFGVRGRPAREPALSLVERDPVQPRRELRAPLEAREAAPGAQKHLLRHLVGLACVQPEPPQRALNAVGVEHDQFGERLLVAVAGSSNQLVLGA